MNKKAIQINMALNFCNPQDKGSAFYSCIKGAMETTKWLHLDDIRLTQHIPMLVKLLIDPWLATSEPGNFLELGCSHGIFAKLIIDKVNQYTGYDIWPDALWYAAEESLAGSANATLWHGDGRTFKEMAPGSQDFVFSYQTLPHVPTVDIIEGYIFETIRVLSERGVGRLHIKGPNATQGMHIGWQNLGALNSRAHSIDDIKRQVLARFATLLQAFLPPHFLIPRLMGSPADHPEWKVGACLNPSKAISMVRQRGWNAEVIPCSQSLPVYRNIWDSYWLVIYKDDPPAFIRFC